LWCVGCWVVGLVGGLGGGGFGFGVLGFGFWGLGLCKLRV
jgi:hypothetical protein